MLHFFAYKATCNSCPIYKYMKHIFKRNIIVTPMELYTNVIYVILIYYSCIISFDPYVVVFFLFRVTVIPLLHEFNVLH